MPNWYRIVLASCVAVAAISFISLHPFVFVLYWNKFLDKDSIEPAKGNNDSIKSINKTITNESTTIILSRHKRSRPRFIEGIEQLDVRQYEDFRAMGSDEPPATFIVYEKSNTKVPLPHPVEFKRSSKVVFYVHGWMTPNLKDGVRMRDALIGNGGDVDYVVVVDWRKLSVPETENPVKLYQHYKEAAFNGVPRVSSFMKDFILKHLSKDHFIHIVGFSLGGQVAGMAARLTAADPKGFKIQRVTGLDPAGAIFEYSLYLMFPVDTSNSIRLTDAQFVDIIHACPNLGIEKPAGHLDIYVSENKCGLLDFLCQHYKAVKAFLASLNNCSLIACPRHDICTSRSVTSAGYLADKYDGRGIYDIDFRLPSFEGGWKDKECSEYMNVYIPAKDRMCKEGGKGCGNNKPFLAQCYTQNKCGAVCSVNKDFRIGNAVGMNGKNYTEVKWFCLNGNSYSKNKKGGG